MRCPPQRIAERAASRMGKVGGESIWSEMPPCRVSGGTRKSTLVGVTFRSGAGAPPTNTRRPPSDSGRGGNAEKVAGRESSAGDHGAPAPGQGRRRSGHVWRAGHKFLDLAGGGRNSEQPAAKRTRIDYAAVARDDGLR